MTLTTRSLSAVLVGDLALALLAGCSPEPDTTPTPAFASADEAFEAAETTYRAYTDAVNAIDLADEATFEDVYVWLTDTALAAEKEALSLYHAENLTRLGTTTFDTFTPRSAGIDGIIIDLCIDVSGVELVDPAGASVLPADRPPRTARKVTFTVGDNSGRLRIASNRQADAGFTC